MDLIGRAAALGLALAGVALAQPAAAQVSRYQEIGRGDGRIVYIDRVPAARSGTGGDAVVRTRALMAFDPPQAQEGGAVVAQARYELAIRCGDRKYSLVNWNAANAAGEIVGKAALPLAEDWQPGGAQTQFGTVVESACTPDVLMTYTERNDSPTVISALGVGVPAQCEVRAVPGLLLAPKQDGVPGHAEFAMGTEDAGLLLAFDQTDAGGRVGGRMVVPPVEGTTTIAVLADGRPLAGHFNVSPPGGEFTEISPDVNARDALAQALLSAGRLELVVTDRASRRELRRGQWDVAAVPAVLQQLEGLGWSCSR